MENDPIQRQIHDEIIPRDRAFLDRVAALLNAQIKAADVFMEWNRQDLGEALKPELEEALNLRQKIKTHTQAYIAYSTGYKFDAAVTTNFEEEIQERIFHQQSRRFHLRDEDEYLTLQECLAGGGRTGAESSVPVEPEVGDEEIEVLEENEYGILNTHCPLSGKAIEDLMMPVVDTVGYVYEKDALQRHIDDYWEERSEEFMNVEHGVVKCPVAGTQHTVKVADLKPAFGLIRGLKRKRRQGAGPSSQSQAI